MTRGNFKFIFYFEKMTSFLAVFSDGPLCIGASRLATVMATDFIRK
jgi:hypothetical protein